MRIIAAALMEIQNTYRTLREPSEGMYKEKGSKFIGFAVPCYSEEEAKEFLSRWRKEHHQARHVCYAYRFGVEKNNWRANDDGEPGNSAGPPILGQIEAFDLSNVLIGVVRYFGGTKLGVGGLIHAYKTAAKEAIENGEIVELEVFYWLRLEFGYADMAGVMNVLKKHNLSLKTKEFSESCLLTTAVPLSEVETVRSELEGFESMKMTELGIY